MSKCNRIVNVNKLTVFTCTESGSHSYFNISHLVAMINIAVHMWINLKISYEFLVRLERL